MQERGESYIEKLGPKKKRGSVGGGRGRRSGRQMKGRDGSIPRRRYPKISVTGRQLQGKYAGGARLQVTGRKNVSDDFR